MGEEQTLFSAGFNGSVHTEARGERLTSDSGAVLLRQTMDDLDLIEDLVPQRPDPRPSLQALMDQPQPLNLGAIPAHPSAPLEHHEIDAALLHWLLSPPRLAPPLPPRKTPRRSERVEAADGPEPGCVDTPALDEAGEVDVAKLPAWMRGLPEHGPPTAEEA